MCSRDCDWHKNLKCVCTHVRIVSIWVYIVKSHVHGFMNVCACACPQKNACLCVSASVGARMHLWVLSNYVCVSWMYLYGQTVAWLHSCTRVLWGSVQCYLCLRSCVVLLGACFGSCPCRLHVFLWAFVHVRVCTMMMWVWTHSMHLQAHLSTWFSILFSVSLCAYVCIVLHTLSLCICVSVMV